MVGPEVIVAGGTGAVSVIAAVTAVNVWRGAYRESIWGSAKQWLIVAGIWAVAFGAHINGVIV